MIKRHTHLLNEFSRKESEAELRKQIQRTRKEVEINGGVQGDNTIKD